MNRRWNVFVRTAGGIALAVVGYGAGAALLASDQADSLDQIQQAALVQGLLAVSFALFGFALGYMITPALLKPLDTAYRELREIPAPTLAAATVGFAIGLLLSALLALPLSFLPPPFGSYLPILTAIALGYLGTATVGHDPGAYLDVLRGLVGRSPEGGSEGGRHILLDTSVIIDGRVADVAETGFLDKVLLVPRFVLAELQNIADSQDDLRRRRGRRGLEILNQLQNSEHVEVEIGDEDVPGTRDVDRKLVRLAQRLDCAVMTNDFNLNRVAEIEGVTVLNLNELANAIKTIVLPGEILHVRVIQEGKEYGQGVGYLDDGTMVVVEGARDRIDEVLGVSVTRVLQTVAGRMIFAQPEEAQEARSA